MTIKNFPLLLTAVFVLACSCCVTAVGETLVNENFNQFNPNELLPGWSKAEPLLISMVDEPDHGKVLKLVNKDEHYPFVMYTLDAGKVAGKKVTMSIAAKFPGNFVPLADKAWAAPKLILEVKDAGGNLLQTDALLQPQANKPEWQKLEKTVTVPANAVSVCAQICIQYVTCEVYFDDLRIELAEAQVAVVAPPPVVPAPPANGAKAVPPAPVAPAVPGTPPVPAKPPVPSADPNSPAALAAKSAPKKTLDDGGMTFGPDYAASLQQSYPSKTVNSGKALFIGPGIGEKDPPIKLQKTWQVLPYPAKLVGKLARPRALLASLPELLAKEKPEVVFIFGDAASREATTTEADDWLDIALLCKHYGALPVLAPHPSAGKDAKDKDDPFEQISQALKKAETLGSLLVISPVPQELFPKRAGHLLTLLDTHVFLRVKQDPAGAPGSPTTKPQDE
jgi:hypothetical protein